MISPHPTQVRGWGEGTGGLHRYSQVWDVMHPGAHSRPRTECVSSLRIYRRKNPSVLVLGYSSVCLEATPAIIPSS